MRDVSPSARVIRQTIPSIRVTALLVALGAILGAASGMAILGVLLVVRDGTAALLDWSFLSFVLAAEFGAAAGAVAGPLIGWVLLRHVALGGALLWTAVGTIAGAVVGELLRPLHSIDGGIPALFVGGVAGLVIGGIAVRVRTGRLRA